MRLQRAVDSAASTARFSLNDRMMIRGGQRLLWFLKKARGLLKKCFGESVKRIRAFDVNAGTFFWRKEGTDKKESDGNLSITI